MKYSVLFLLMHLAACDLSIKKDNDNNVLVKDERLVDTTQTYSPARHYLKSVIEKFGKSEVLTGLYFIERNSLNNTAVKIDSLNLLYCRITSFFETDTINADSIIDTAENYYGNIEPVKRERSLKKLNIWLKNNILLNSVMDNLSDELFFEQIINDISDTRPLIQKYLKDPKQYWGSLDENQMCKLYYDVCRYLLKLDESNRIIFFKKYFNTACNLSLKEDGH